jgi:hypothetical protein
LANFNPFKPNPTNITMGESIITDIARVKDLTTTIYSVQQTIQRRVDGTWLQTISYNMVMVVGGTVEAGLDLDELHASDVSLSEDGKILTVQLPPVKILTDPGHVLSNDPEDTYVFISDFQRTAAISSFDLEKQITSEAGGDIIQTACEDGILTTATDDAKTAIERLLKTTYPNYTVNVVSAPVPACTIPGNS